MKWNYMIMGAEAECYDNWMRPALVWVFDYQDIQYIQCTTF